MKKLIFLSLAVVAMSFGVVRYLKAQEQAITVTYPADSVIIDSDLDGLTDEGEIQIYKTDPKNPDTDGDGIYDGAEVIQKTNPLDSNNTTILTTPDQPLVAAEEMTVPTVERDTPWPWYVVRSAGLIGFALLYISIFLGLAIRIPILNRIIKPVYSSQVHCWTSLQALLFALLHGVTLIFDKFAQFSLPDVFIPFAYPSGSTIDSNMVALGIIGLYFMILLVVTSYARRFISHAFWRAVHFTNIALYIVVVIHALMLGTDLRNPVFRDWFVFANELLVAMMVFSLVLRLRRKKGLPTKPQPPISTDSAKAI